jgi:galactokinase
VICNSLVRHALAAGEYNLRRHDCEEAVRVLGDGFPKIKALRDVRLADLEISREKLGSQLYRRSRHVVTENERVLQAAQALRTNDVRRFGELMYESHLSLRDDYEVSCTELDLLVDIAKRCEGVYGARMTGGGFGGCTVNLVVNDALEQFRSYVTFEYAKITGKTPEIYVCSAGEGAGRVT